MNCRNGKLSTTKTHVKLFTKNRNVIIAALILVLSIGIKFTSVYNAAGEEVIAGGINFAIGSVNISLSGLAVAAIVGIVLNAILPGKDYKFADEESKEE